MQRFLQEHGEVQLSALGLGTNLLVCFRFMSCTFKSANCILLNEHDRGKGEVKTSLQLSLQW